MAVALPACWMVSHLGSRLAYMALEEDLASSEGKQDQAGLKIFQPPPQCPQCAATLSAAEMLPVLGWAMSGGHCRSCGSGIPGLYPVAEAVSLLVPPAALLIYGVTPAALVFSLACWTLIALALMDAGFGLVVDRLTLPLLGGALLAAALDLWPLPPEDAILGAFTGWAYLRLGNWYTARRHGDDAATGWGDMKLAAAIGALTGPVLIFVLLVASTGIASLLMVAVAAARRTSPAQARLRFAPVLVPISLMALALPGFISVDSAMAAAGRYLGGMP